METKTCTKCNTPKLTTEFHKRGAKLHSWCKDCKRTLDKDGYEGNKTNVLKNKKIWLAKFRKWYIGLKRGKKCNRCKNVYHHSIMEWDHLPGVKKVATICHLFSQRNKTAIIEEIKKCQLLCANCHAWLTFKRRNGV